MQTLLKILAEKIARGNAVQIHLNFPAKSLSVYIQKIFLETFLI